MSALDALFPDHLATLAERQDAALEAAGLDSVAIHSGAIRYQFLDDRPYGFAVNPHFAHWAPLTQHPDSWVVYRPGTRPRLVVCVPQDFWHLPPPLPAGGWAEHFDVTIVADPPAAREALPADRRHMAFIGEDEQMAEAIGFAAVNPGQVLNVLHYRRAWKTPYELACMREASRLAAHAHRAAEAAFRRGASELTIHAAYLAAIGFRDEDLPYGNIVALNEHAAILHYQALDRSPPAVSRSFLIDAGARCRGYASDVTRTYASEAGLFAELVAALDERQRDLVAGCRAGTDFRELHLAAHRHVGELLLAIGLARGTSVEALIAERITSAFFPHGLGHLLGIQVHDVAGHAAGEDDTTIEPPDGHPFLRLTRVLAPGMVTTVEPGVYVIDALLAPLKEAPAGRAIAWDRVAALRPFGGVRIEDDVLVTDGEPENLTREAFARAI